MKRSVFRKGGPRSFAIYPWHSLPTIVAPTIFIVTDLCPVIIAFKSRDLAQSRILDLPIPFQYRKYPDFCIKQYLSDTHCWSRVTIRPMFIDGRMELRSYI